MKSSSKSAVYCQVFAFRLEHDADAFAVEVKQARYATTAFAGTVWQIIRRF
jgi:hypothetical protein